MHTQTLRALTRALRPPHPQPSTPPRVGSGPGRSCLLGLLLLAASLRAGDSERLDGAATIRWDRWGVPHIQAPSTPELFRAFGWAQMQAHGDLLLRLIGQARARAAEYWGEKFIESDQWVLTLKPENLEDRWLEAQPGEFRRNLEAFCAGIAAYAQRHPDRIGAAWRIVLPVTPRDLLAHQLRVMLLQFVAQPWATLPQAKRWEAGGSNGWAIGPRKSATGRAILLANPHLPWGDFYTFFEAHLQAPQFDAYGAALVGQPCLTIAFNRHLGWTHTVNTQDGSDLYELTLTPPGDAHLLDGRPVPLETRTVALAVRQADGTLRRQPFELRRSRHGPLVARRGGKALALRIVGLDRPRSLAQWWQMAAARDFNAFRSALKQMQLPTLTVLYADAEGHLLHFFGGHTPRRPAGPWEWSGVLPGDSARTLWKDYLRYEELPRLEDPASGWLQNANDPPWRTTLRDGQAALDPQAFPPYLAPEFLHFRAQRSIRLLEAPGPLSLEEVIRRKHDTRMELADHLLDPLLAAAQNRPALAQAVAVLRAWDRSTLSGSRGAALFYLFYLQALKDWQTGHPQDSLRTLRPSHNPMNLFLEPWSPGQPLGTPSGLGRTEATLQALAVAAEGMLKRFGSLDLPWGELFRVRVGSVDLPANGGPDAFGCFRTLEFVPGADGKQQAYQGDTYVSVVEFSTPPRAFALLSYGNASQAGSPHLGDQLPLFARQELRPVWLTEDEIRSNLESVTVLGSPDE